MVGKNRLFSEEKLEELSAGFRDLIMQALDAGDIEKAKYWVERSHEMRYVVHDSMVHALSIALSHIYTRYGENEAVNTTRDALMGFVPEWAATKKALIAEKGLEEGTRAWVEFVSDTWRKHYGKFTVTEDDEKIIFTHDPCGSGGRLVMSEIYDGPFGYARIQEAGPGNWGEEDVPIYCMHCSWAHEIIPIKIAGPGAQFWVHDSPCPRKPGDKCVHYIYKDPDKIPEKYYERFGLKKNPPEKMPKV